MALWIGGVGTLLLLVTFFLFLAGVFTLPSITRSTVDASILFFALIGLTLWGIFLLYRMQNSVAWILFLWILLLTQLRLYSGFLKRFVGWDDAADLFLWHFSYGPMLFLPGLWLCLVLSDFTKTNIKRLVVFLDIVAGILFLLVMFNDLHHWAWTPKFDANGTLTGWKSGPLYFVVGGYIFLLLGLSVFHLIYGTLNKRNSLKEVLLLLVPLALLVAYTILYFLNVKWIRKTPFINNYYVMDSFFGFLLMEAALQSGLVQNAGFYRSFFIKGPFYLALAYPDYRLFERNEAFQMSEEIKTKDEAVVGGKRYRKKAVEGGFLLLEEDISDLLRLQTELMEKQQELQKTTRLLEGREAVEEEMTRYSVRTKLNESLFGEIRLESDAIEKLVASLPDHLTPETRQSCAKSLESLQNRLAFLKQRCLFFINADEEGSLPYEDFALSEGSLCRDLANVGFEVAFSYPSFQTLPLVDALVINGFMRSLVEAFHDSRGGLLLSYDPNKRTLKARVLPTPEFELRKIRFGPLIEKEEEEYRFSLVLEA